MSLASRISPSRVLYRPSIVHRKFSNIPSVQQDPLFWLNHRKVRLRQLANKLSLDHPNVFIASGIEYGPLPFRYPGTPEFLQDGGLSDSRLRYLTALWAVNGSIIFPPSQRIPRLVVTAVYDRAETLLEFAKAFGGVIYMAQRVRGFKTPAVQWYVDGPNFPAACKILSTLPSPRQQRLRLFCEPIPRGQANKIRTEMYRLRQQEKFSEDFIGSTEHMAGVLDGHGSLLRIDRACGLPPRTEIRCSAKENVIKAIQVFLRSRGIGSGFVSYRHKDGRADWCYS